MILIHCNCLQRRTCLGEQTCLHVNMHTIPSKVRMKGKVHQSDYNIIFVSRCLPKEWLTPNALEATIAETRGANNSNSGRIIAMLI